MRDRIVVRYPHMIHTHSLSLNRFLCTCMQSPMPSLFTTVAVTNGRLLQMDAFLHTLMVHSAQPRDGVAWREACLSRLRD